MSCLRCLQCWYFRLGCLSPHLDTYALYPPYPETYQFLPVKHQPHKYEYRQLRHFCCDTALRNFIPYESFFVRSKSKNSIACMYIHIRPDPDFVIMLSGGNGSDLGLHAQICFQFSAYLDCNVIAYDYSGYGISSGRPSEKNILLDAESVFEVCKNKFKLKTEQMVLMGVSLGSHPACHLAAKIDNIAGLILVSPIMSLCRVVCPSRVTNCGDHFNNLALVKAKPMSVKTLFLHGSDDCFVSCKHSEKLHKQMGVSHSRYEQIPSAGHTDVFEFEEAWYKIVEFLKDLFPKYSHSILSNSAHVVHSRGETTQSCCEKTESVNNVEAVEKEQIASELTACEFEEKSL